MLNRLIISIFLIWDRIIYMSENIKIILMTIIVNLPVFTIISFHDIQIASVTQKINISVFNRCSYSTSWFIEMKTVIKPAIF